MSRDKCEGCDKPATHSDDAGVPLCKECRDAILPGTPTPRTDAAEHELHQTWTGATMRKCRDGGWVDTDFARQLERELAEAKAQIEELHGWRNELGFRYNRAKDELAALRRDKAQLLALVIRYRNETPLGHQPHMIAADADAAIDAAMEGKS